ncbi:hypothetical protein [Salimicrobium album]|uniref:DUF4760 domain-containing protein n=1 Tax=Salimicrobium album TaxID=50717 RepID=A0A1H3GE95_9BACI|nr:hypothetical protein [Salimicrobium album]SDY01596.1 hypothetical protein SAMN04488081_1902 [Salimicrobium album]
MSTFEVISAMISVLSFVLALFAVIYTRLSISISKSNVLRNINDSILKASDSISQMTHNMAPLIASRIDKTLTEGQKKSWEHYSVSFDIKTSDYLNSYEVACLMYLGKKVNKKDFEKLYKQDIINLFERDIFKEKLNDGNEHYGNLKKTYSQMKELDI